MRVTLAQYRWIHVYASDFIVCSEQISQVLYWISTIHFEQVNSGWDINFFFFFQILIRIFNLV